MRFIRSDAGRRTSDAIIFPSPGGVHPPENKTQSLRQPIGALPLPPLLMVPLNQHIGAAAVPVVKPGDTVIKGQKIAEPVGLVSAAVHAPTSGTVTEISEQPAPHPSGMSARCICIQPDGRDQWCETTGIDNYKEVQPERLLEIIRHAGIAGLGGAGFPAAVKLSPWQPIKTLIINGTECEPYITSDDALMRERPAGIIQGIQILAHILGNPQEILIGIEDNKPQAYEALAPLLKDLLLENRRVELVEFPTKYPSGGEKQLVQILTGQEVPSGQLPAELGIVCQNVGTAFAVYEAICLGKPLISRITTVTGNACATQRNYEVLIGTPIQHLLDHNGFNPADCSRVIMGGPMMGFTLESLMAPVIKTTNCILAPSLEEMPPPPPAQPCIRCGLCAEACPASLLPQQLFWYAQADNHDRLQAHNLFDCIECGACAYVCPSHIPLVQYYRAAKGAIRKEEQDRSRADQARVRFEFHQERVEKEAAEKAARREARRRAAAEAAASNPGADDIIQAAMARANAKKQSPEQQKAKLERTLQALRNSLDSAEQKLAQGEAEHLPTGALDKLRAKLEDNRLRLVDTASKLQVLQGEKSE